MKLQISANSFPWVYAQLQDGLKHARAVHMNEWQSQAVDHTTYELRNVVFSSPVRDTVEGNQTEYEPNLPWAEDHFLERVGGWPLNPPPSEAWWPHAVQGNDQHKDGEIFSHTYPERMWSKFANIGNKRPNGRQVYVPHQGIRYEYGDLDDVVAQLIASHHTRQAYLPIWFPEDTGSTEGQRVPCTLGYHFLCRNNHLDTTYFIRSCDFVRHMRDDAYMAARLCQWMADKVGVGVGVLTMHIVSLHIFEPDRIRMLKEEE